jgi:hypothetical protein
LASTRELSTQREASPPAPSKLGPASPQRYIRFAEDTTTSEAQKRHRVQLSTQERSILPPGSAAAELGSPSTRITSVKSQDVEWKDETPSRSSIHFLKPMLYRGRRSTDAAEAREYVERPEVGIERTPRGTPKSSIRRFVRLTTPVEAEEKALRDDKATTSVLARGRSRLSAWRSRRRASLSTDTGSPIPRSRVRRENRTGYLELGSPRRLSPRQRIAGSRSAPVNESRKSKGEVPAGSVDKPASAAETRRESISRVNTHSLDEVAFESGTVTSGQESGHRGRSRRTQETFGKSASQSAPCEKVTASRRRQNLTEGASRTIPASLSPTKFSAQPTLGSVSRLKPVKSAGTTVKAMAARFESASEDPVLVQSRGQKVNSRDGFKPSSVASRYTVNPSPEAPSQSPKTPTRRELLMVRHRQRSIEVMSEEVTVELSGLIPWGNQLAEAVQSQGFGDAAVSTRGEPTVKPQSPLVRDISTQPARPTTAPLFPDRETPPPWKARPTPVPEQEQDSPEQPHAALPLLPNEQHQALTTAALHAAVQSQQHRHQHEQANSPSPPPLTRRSSKRLIATATPQQQQGACAEQDNELARLREQLCHAEQACFMWRGRAERAEQALERRAGASDGVGDGEVLE